MEICQWTPLTVFPSPVPDTLTGIYMISVAILKSSNPLTENGDLSHINTCQGVATFQRENDFNQTSLR